MLFGPTVLGQTGSKFFIFFLCYVIFLLGAELGTGVTVWHHYWNSFKFSTGLG